MALFWFWPKNIKANAAAAMAKKIYTSHLEISKAEAISIPKAKLMAMPIKILLLEIEVKSFHFGLVASD